MDVNSINFYLAIFLLVLRKVSLKNYFWFRWLSVINLCYLFFQQLIVAMMCPYKCSCPDEPTHCPNNEALVSDGCDCCMVCSRQLGQPCNNIYICDPTKGLSCRYSMSSLDTEYGVCTGEIICINYKVMLKWFLIRFVLVYAYFKEITSKLKF